MDFLKRTWAEVNLDNLAFNLNSVREKISKECDIIGVVKADGYGHGDIFIARELETNGVKKFAVSNLIEAIRLRSNGIEEDIIILGATPSCYYQELVKYNITQTIYCFDYAQELIEESRKHLDAKSLKIHIKIDTGMGRIGFNVFQKEQIIAVINNDCFDMCGIFTHLSCADQKDKESVLFTQKQVDDFLDCCSDLERTGYNLGCKHILNSAGIISYGRQYSLDGVRPGIILYGLIPGNELIGDIELKQVFSLKTVISMIKMVKKGDSISYGRTYVAQKDMKIATVPIGYADGYSRKMSGKGKMIVDGKLANIVGRVCMDQLMLDVTEIENVNIGDIVTVFGEDGDEFISIDEIAKEMDSINYEVCCLIGKRVPRVYLKNGKKTDAIDYILSAYTEEKSDV